jgi:hypothetical protein
MEELEKKIQEAVNAANLLIKNKLYKEAASKFWSAVRSSIFYHLNEKNIGYSSTKEALNKIVLEYDIKKISDNILFVETIGTLSEWDEYFKINEEQIIDFKNTCIKIILKFVHVEIYEKTNEYELLTEEIGRHKEDVESAMSTHYAAAMRNENSYNKLLLCGFVITLLGLSCFLCSLSNYLCFCKDWIGQSITLVGACTTLWPLIKDYSGKAVQHRQSANEYNSIFKKCNNWKSDFPNEDFIIEAKRDIHIIRNSINHINFLSPKTENIDYKRGKKNIDLGSYTYDNMIIQQNNKYSYSQLSNTKEKMGKENDIAIKQNSPEAIQLLKAQRIAYTYSKRYGYIDIVIILISLTFYICYVSMSSITEFLDPYRLLLLIGVLVMLAVSKIQKTKTLIGACIQENFDNELFGLPQNKILTPAYPSIEIITDYSYKYKKDDMSDWYMEYLISKQSQPIAVLRCQLGNLIWDKEQRKAFKTVIIILSILMAVGFLIISYVNNYCFQEWLKMLILISPIITYLIKNIIGQNEMITNKDNAIEYVFSLLDRHNKENYIPTETELRDVQNNIYIQRTQVQSTISNIWYRIRKKSTQKYVERVFDNFK